MARIKYKKFLISILASTVALIQSSGSFAKAAEEGTTPLKGSASVINITSDRMEYLDSKNQIVATGNVIIIVDKDGTRVESDKVIYDKNNEQIISEGDVKITKAGAVMFGDYAKFNLLTDSALINDPETYLSAIKINAREAKINSNELQMDNGKISLNNKDMVLMLSTGAMSNSENPANKFIQERPDIKPHLKYNIKAKEIIVNDNPKNKIVTLKNATISINRYKIARVPSMKISTMQEEGFITIKKDEKTGYPVLKTVVTDSQGSKIENFLPEFGHEHELGAYVGYGHVFNFKSGSTLKAVPIVTWGKGEGGSFGGGAMARYMSPTNKTQLHYSTMKGKVLLDGEQRILSPHTKLVYGANQYIENGFFGYQKPDYICEIADNRDLIQTNNLDFKLRSTAGLIESADSNYSVGRFQLQGVVRNIEPFWKYKKYISVGGSAAGHLGVYGNGDTYGVARIGPEVGTTLGPLNLWTAYYQGGIGGNTPLLFDRYLYGKSNLVGQATLKVTKNLSLGYLASLNLTKDSWEEKLITENQIYVWVGPEDLKFRLGYDIKRERSVFGFSMLVGAEDSVIDFEKLKVMQKL